MLESGSSKIQSKIALLKTEQARLLAVVVGQIKENLRPADTLVDLALINFKLHEQTVGEAHSRLRAALKDKGFTKATDSNSPEGESHTRPTANNHTISVSLHGGKAHTRLTQNGVIRGYIGSSMTVGGLHHDINNAESAAEESGETNGVEASEEGKVAS